MDKNPHERLLTVSGPQYEGGNKKLNESELKQLKER